MKTQSNQPADTRMMGIVHDALRRDLSRATAALDIDARPRPTSSGWPSPPTSGG